MGGVVTEQEQLSTNKQLVLDFFSIYEDHRYDRMPELIASSYADHSPAGARNPDDVVRTLQSVKRAFPDLQLKVLDVIAEGDRVMVRASFSGTHSADYMDTVAKHRHLEWEALELFRIADHRIVESWGTWPAQQMLEQMR
jgi:predicted SnoaL-like aldol condensation-catalyzing enzyme